MTPTVRQDRDSYAVAARIPSVPAAGLDYVAGTTVTVTWASTPVSSRTSTR
jgi:hypothetical protein